LIHCKRKSFHIDRERERENGKGRGKGKRERGKGKGEIIMSAELTPAFLAQCMLNILLTYSGHFHAD
jgi:hypothetical protein